ncbi:MAG: hypothetical protein Q9222_004010 [Ikaeria aurantiellina]
MDFWSRLIGASNTSAANKPINPHGPEQRLTNFKRAFLQLQQTCKKKNDHYHLQAAFRADFAPQLQNINRILQDETHAAGPHLCMQNVATAQSYRLVSMIGSTAHEEDLIKEAVRFFGLLIDNEDEDFLQDAAFADRLLSFIQDTSSPIAGATGDTRNETVELLFAVAARLRQRPEFPTAWFRPSSGVDAYGTPIATTPSIKVHEFPLVYMLLDYLPCDGEVGDFARTGLLYILESAARFEKLERWVIESELATMMASGLGALYSQLSSKVTLSYAADSMPPVLAFSDVSVSKDRYDADPVFSNALQAKLATLISYLVFWQDLLERCPSTDIKATLLEHFDFLFLRPVLYPSLVESSDIDSGSSVAVMTYIACVLENLSNSDIAGLILRYMLGATVDALPDIKSSRPSTLARRRKSETLITKSQNRPDEPSPDLLTLANILHGYLQSSNQQTVTTSLRLLATILRSWHDLAATTLFKVQKIQETHKRTREEHEQNLEVLFSMAEDVSDDDSIQEAFEAHLQDARISLETHPCSASQLLPFNGDNLEAVLSQKSSSPNSQRIMLSDDPLLTDLLALLEDFLVNDIEVNLSLSENLAALASCSQSKLEGWLLPPPPDEDQPRSGDAGLDKSLHPAIRDKATETVSANSPVFSRLNALVQRIDKLRLEIQDFDIYLAERRHVFRVGEEIDHVLADVPNQRSQDVGKSKELASREPGIVGSISERLQSPRDLSRASSPRGRQEASISSRQSQPKSLVGRLSHLRLSPSPNASRPLERAYSPSPLRKGSLSSGTSSPLPSPRGPPDILRRKIRLEAHPRHRDYSRQSVESETSSVRSDFSITDSETRVITREIRLSHLLTNIIILQEFILELAAIIQVRASLFGEIKI